MDWDAGKKHNVHPRCKSVPLPDLGLARQSMKFIVRFKEGKLGLSFVAAVARCSGGPLGEEG